MQSTRALCAGLDEAFVGVNGLKLYRIVPALGSGEDGATIEFMGDEPSEVFRLIEHAGSGERFTLWEGERCLGILRHDANGFWELR